MRMTVPDDEYKKKRKIPAPWYTALENFVTDYFLFFVIALVLGWLLYSAFFPESEPIDLPGYQIDFY